MYRPEFIGVSVCLGKDLILSFFPLQLRNAKLSDFTSLWCWELLLMWEERNLGEISEGCFFKGTVAVRGVEMEAEERWKERENESPSVVIYHACGMMVMTGILNGRGRGDNKSKVDTDANAIWMAKIERERRNRERQKMVWYNMHAKLVGTSSELD